MYLLDTDTFSNLIAPSRSYPQLVRRIAANDPSALFISIVSVEEILRGAVGSRDLRSPASSERRIAGYRHLQRLLQALVRLQVVPYDAQAEAAFLAIPDSVRHHHPRDCRIAAIAQARGFVVITRNLKDFRAAGVRCEDWTAG